MQPRPIWYDKQRPCADSAKHIADFFSTSFFLVSFFSFKCHAQLNCTHNTKFPVNKFACKPYRMWVRFCWKFLSFCFIWIWIAIYCWHSTGIIWLQENGRAHWIFEQRWVSEWIKGRRARRVLIDRFESRRYEGKCLDSQVFGEALQEGIKAETFRGLLVWICSELRVLANLEEEVCFEDLCCVLGMIHGFGF